MPALLDDPDMVSAESLGWACEPHVAQLHVSESIWGEGHTGWGKARVHEQWNFEPPAAAHSVSTVASASSVRSRAVSLGCVPHAGDDDVANVSSSVTEEEGVPGSHTSPATPEPLNPVLLSDVPDTQAGRALPRAVERSHVAANGVVSDESVACSMDDVLPLSSLEVAAKAAPSVPTVNTLPGMPCSLADVAVSSSYVPDPMDDEVLSVSSSGTAGECTLSPDSHLKPGQSSPSDRSPLLASNSGVPVSLQLPPLQLPAGSRFFLDICSGATCPLASAAVALGIPAISVDVLRNPAHDLLDVAFFERILRLAFSGRIAMGHGSPPCCEYSLLKLRPGGPPPCRSPQHLNGLPGNDAAAENGVQQSRTILERTIAILYAVYQSGGHVSLEQPRNSMSWLEPAAQGFMLDISADLVAVAACAFGMAFDKHWLFATSWSLQSLQSTCPHAAGFHDSFAGIQDASGGFLSRKTAIFPEALAQEYTKLIAPLFPGVVAPTMEVTVEQATSCIPVRPESSFPRACQDGGGIYSVPDWASPPPGTSDVFRTLRRDFMQLFASAKPLCACVNK